VVTSSVQLIEIDLNTMKKEDVNFSVPFSLEAKHDDYLHAFVTFFNVDFSQCHKRVWFSTSPEGPYTHWKQTVFYLSDYATLKKHETVYGRFELRQNPRNNRDLDFTVQLDFDGELSQLHEKNTYRMR